MVGSYYGVVWKEGSVLSPRVISEISPSTEICTSLLRPLIACAHPGTQIFDG